MDVDQENIRIDVDGFTVNQAFPPQLPYDNSEECQSTDTNDSGDNQD